jgi:hypothetical protein
LLFIYSFLLDLFSLSLGGPLAFWCRHTEVNVY